jgi:DNA-binding beta-propeller fold protein YncE
MKNDIGRVSFDELNHFVGVFHQMGRLPLESDFNEQNELVLRLMQRLAGDAMHTGSPNEGFRVDTHVLLDRLDSRSGWSAAPAGAAVFVDYFDHRVGDGSLAAQGATALARKLPAPLDLGGVNEVLIAVKTASAAPLVFYVSDGSAAHPFTMSSVGTDDGWQLVRGVPGAWPAGFNAARIVEYGFTGLETTARYSFDVLKADLPLRTVLVRPELSGQYSLLPATAQLAADDDQRLWGSSALRATQATAVAHALPVPADASRARRLLVSLQRSPAAAPLTLMLRDAATPSAAITLAGAAVSMQNGWEVHSFALPQAGAFDWTQVAELGYAALDPAATYHFGPVLLEADPARDLVVMGGDGSSAGAGRFYGEGLAATRESHGTYFTQAELPQADPAALEPVAAGRRRIDWAYLDLWERPLSYVERPALREVALEGADTCTRKQLVAQVRLLRGVDVPLAATPLPPSDVFAQLPRSGRGVLSTKDKPAAVLDPCADPCEPLIAGPYLGEENRLFRVEIHRAGNIGPAGAAGTAWFKWSRDNAGVLCALVADAAAAATSVQVEKPELFAIGDLVEVCDDLAELVTGAYEDRVAHASHLRGELRKVVTVNLQTRRISWEDPTVADPLELPFHAPLPRALRLAHHAKLTRWDGSAACTPGDIVLADGVVIELGGQALCAGDHWLFATRTLDRSVERLVEAPPRGTLHAYYPLAAIHRSRGAAPAPELVFAQDLRPRFAALPGLDASRIAYDPGAGLAEHPVDGWAEVGTVQEAIDALCRADLTGDLRLHNRLLHGMGVICGLKLRCLRDREQVVLGKGYALDCDGDLLHQAGESAIPLVQRATDQGLLDASGNGKVNLWIERAAGGVSTHLEPHVTQGFWDAVLEGTLLKDFYDNTILALVNFFKARLQPFPDTTLPLSDPHRRVIALLNLAWQWVNSASGRYIYLSRPEHDLLSQLHEDLQELLASKSGYCAMFDHLQVFPPYPYAEPTGIDTVFGMVLMHKRLRLDPAGRYAYGCGGGNRLQLFDVAARRAVAVTDFPGAANVQVQDVAFNAAGTEVYVVATLSHGTHIDSVFATLTVTPPVAPATEPVLAWGGASVVCDIEFVTLAAHANQPSAVFAVGRSAADPARRGVYRINPAAVPLSPVPHVPFNATGLLVIDTNGVDAVASQHSGGSQSGSFDGLRRMNLNTQATSVAFLAAGDSFEDDLAVAGGAVFLTGTSGGAAVLHRYLLPTSTTLALVTLGSSTTVWRLALLPARNQLALADANTYRVRLFNTATGLLSTTSRIPVQIIPIGLAARGDGRELYALNYLSNTVSAIDLDTLGAAPPSFTDEPPASLGTYRDDMLQAFTDLFSVFGQYLKDAWCDQFLVEEHECSGEDKVYLGTIEIRNSRVFHICNFSKRHYAKSFRTWSYWLSAVPLLPMLKKAFAKFCCLKLVP